MKVSDFLRVIKGMNCIKIELVNPETWETDKDFHYSLDKDDCQALTWDYGDYSKTEYVISRWNEKYNDADYDVVDVNIGGDDADICNIRVKKVNG